MAKSFQPVVVKGDRPEFAKKLAAYMNHHALPQAELSRTSGVHTSTLNAILHSKRSITMEQAIDLAAAMDADLVWFLDERRTWPPPAAGRPGVKLTDGERDILELARLVSGGDATLDEAKRRLVQAGGRAHEEPLTPRDRVNGDEPDGRKRRRNG